MNNENESSTGMEPLPAEPDFYGPRLEISGLYECRRRRFPPRWRAENTCSPMDTPKPVPSPSAHETGPDIEPYSPQSLVFPWRIQREELRVDVDGRYPQMTVSGTVSTGLKFRCHWIAQVSSSGRNRWAGEIWYKDGTKSLVPFSHVSLSAVPSWYPEHRRVSVMFSDVSGRNRRVTYSFKSLFFHPVEFEFDKVSHAIFTPAIGTHDHPNHPSTIPDEELSIETVFERAGFEVSRSGDNIVPFDESGPDTMWSNAELHDAMQVHWSRFANRPQWALWFLCAAMHEEGEILAGIMFDDIGPNHRQGAAMFSHSFISVYPPGETHPSEWLRRMRFWTAIHEMGHAFNMAHSWDKSHPPGAGSSWIPLTNDSEARSFMNYPYNVSGGQASFFSDFTFRFSDEELLFMRHAPHRFVQMGNADWFDNHGFEQAQIWQSPRFSLEARVNRTSADFQFLEPIHLELKLKNISNAVQLVSQNALDGGNDLTLIVKKDGSPARQWFPYANYCKQNIATALQPGKSMYESCFVSAGLNGWDIAAPGFYTVQVSVSIGDEDIVSSPLRIRIRPPESFDEEVLAQDIVSEEVGRVLSFNGTRTPVLGAANETLQDAAERLPNRRIAAHARVALAMPGLSTFKELVYDDEGVPSLQIQKPVKDSIDLIAPVLQTDEAAETFGHIDYKRHVDNLSASMSTGGDSKGAREVQGKLHNTMSGRGVLKEVLDGIEKARRSL